MKSYEIQPTYENLLRTYLDDSIARNCDVFRFAEILNLADSNFSIALDGNWGSGKTFFVKQVKMLLDAHNDFVESNVEYDKEQVKKVYSEYLKGEEPALMPQVCVYYDAWENDCDDDPILSLVYTILKTVESNFAFENYQNCLKSAANILEFFTGKQWNKIIDCFRSTSPLDELKAAKGLEEDVREFLDSLLAEHGDRLVIFIDELDRCNPEFAVKLLERIKHHFSNENITFVFSVNISELQHTVKRYYGGDFDAYRYLDRFFDLRVTLPPCDLSRYYRRLEFDGSYYTYDVVCAAVIKTYNFELRDIAKYLKLARVAAYAPTHDSSKYKFRFSDGKAVEFGLLYLVPILIGLKIYNADMYRNFVEGRDCSPLIDVIGNVDTRVFDSLLDNNETYDETEQGKAIADRAEKLSRVYDAIFNDDYTTHYSVVIGEFDFERGLKESLLRTAGLLSDYSDFEA